MRASDATFSVVVPTYDRAPALARCLGSLARQSYPKSHFEVVVVDDGSRDSCEELVDDALADVSHRFVRQRNAGPASARNAGAALARHQMLAFIDDDCVAAPDWLAALADQFASTPEAALGGRTINALTSNPYASASQTLVDYLYDAWTANSGGVPFFTSNNLSMPRASFDRIGGFDTGFRQAAAEDREICDRWVASGYTLEYCPAALIHHYHALDLSGFLRQHFGYGRGAYRFHALRRSRGLSAPRLEPPRFYASLLRYPSRRQRGMELAKTVTLLGLSQVSNACGFVWERRSPFNETR